MAAPAARTSPTYALLADGTTVQIRPATPADFDAVKDMHEAMSPDNTYMRFFGLSSRAAEQEARRLCREPAPGHFALLALLGDAVIGCGSLESGSDLTAADIAFAVADHLQWRGTGTLLLEHLLSAARQRGIRTFTASVLAENAKMLKVFADAGLQVRRTLSEGVIEFAIDLPRGESDPAWEPYLEAVAFRESHADVESLRPLLEPESVAVVGASRKPGSVGRAVLDNLVSSDYRGRVYAVNPHKLDVEGITWAPSVTALSEPPNLAVVAVPPVAVPDVAAECGRRGVNAIVVITAALDDDQGARLLDACRRHSMRLVGPNCFGIAVPGIGLDATSPMGRSVSEPATRWSSCLAVPSSGSACGSTRRDPGRWRVR
jgi:GNAT superfamily N-acetyltransferase/predicted CoA-binding protein